MTKEIFFVIDCVCCKKQLVIFAKDNEDIKQAVKRAGWVEVEVVKKDEYLKDEYDIKSVYGYLCKECYKKIFFEKEND